MKKFVFSFQYVLDAHIAREQAAEHELHTAMREQQELQREREGMALVRGRHVDKLRDMTGVVDRAEYASYRRGIDHIQQQMEALQNRITQHDETIRACRETLRREMTQRKVYEKLREREHEQWAAEMQVDDQKQMDELAVGRWSRQEKAS